MNSTHKEVFQELVDFVLNFEKDSYEEYLTEEFPEIDEDMFFDLDTYTREDMNHIYAYALQARDYLLEDVTYELGT
jgi:hypothetical protein